MVKLRVKFKKQPFYKEISMMKFFQNDEINRISGFFGKTLQYPPLSKNMTKFFPIKV